ncbi:MAG TPA: hypothetical protein PKI20_07015 [Verrucomicrobiota bacterium]|jgi:hypothetical protein|nr:hypothetical protein [Verrucomicrobiota bacterium]HQL77417.1 hypothetical protein [Verrucomicrobiota bacterium]
MRGSSARLGGITKELRAEWLDTKSCWRDAQCEEFEHRYMEELFASVDRAVTVMEQLDKLLTKIKQDCE